MNLCANQEHIDKNGYHISGPQYYGENIISRPYEREYTCTLTSELARPAW